MKKISIITILSALLISCNLTKDSSSKKDDKYQDYLVTTINDTVFGKIEITYNDRVNVKLRSKEKLSYSINQLSIVYKNRYSSFYEPVFVEIYTAITNSTAIKKKLLKYRLSGYFSIYPIYGERYLTYMICIGENSMENPVKRFHVRTNSRLTKKEIRKNSETINRVFSEEKELLDEFNKSGKSLDELFTLLKKYNKLKENK